MTAWIRGFLTVAAVAMIVGAFVSLMGWEIPDKNRDAVMIIIGALIARSEKIDGFFFGSSQNSHEKDKLLAGRGNPQPVEVVNPPSNPVPVEPLDPTEADR